jgi:hypothetical protein
LAKCHATRIFRREDQVRGYAFHQHPQMSGCRKEWAPTFAARFCGRQMSMVLAVTFAVTCSGRPTMVPLSRGHAQRRRWRSPNESFCGVLCHDICVLISSAYEPGIMVEF